MRKLLSILLLSSIWLSSFGQTVPADRIITIPVPSGGVNKGKQSDRYSNITAYNRFFPPRFANNVAFLAAGGKDSTSFYFNSTIGKLILAKQGGTYDTVATSASSTYTASNGLTLTGNNFTLGGNYTSPILVGGSGKVSAYLSDNIGYFGISGRNLLGINNNSGSENIYLTGTNTAGDASVQLSLSANTGSKSVFRDGVNLKGLEYFADYSSNFTARSLPDVGWVQGYSAPISGSGNYLNNQNGTPQTANAWITGQYKSGTSTEYSFMQYDGLYSTTPTNNAYYGFSNATLQNNAGTVKLQLFKDNYRFVNNGFDLEVFAPTLTAGRLQTFQDASGKIALVETTTATVATIADLQAYSGGATTVVVQDALRGGTFNYDNTGVYSTDNGLYFSATGKGGGIWARKTSGLEVYPEWFGATPWSGSGSYVDALTYIQAAINSSTNKASKVVIRYKFKYSGTLYLGQSTEMECSNVAFPKQYYLTDSIQYYIKAGLYHVNAGGGVMIKTTQSVDSYRPQFPKLTNMVLVGDNKNLDTAIVFSNNPNSTAPLNRVGLPYLYGSYIDGFYTGVDCSNQGGDSFQAHYNHFSNLGGYGMRTGSIGETFSSFNDYFNIGLWGVESNGKNEVHYGNEVETGAGGFLLNTAQYGSYTDNKFTNVTNAYKMATGSSRNTINGGSYVNNTGHSIIVDASSGNTIQNAAFTQGSEVATTTQNFIYARQSANLVMSNVTFNRFSGGMTNPLRLDTCTTVALSNVKHYGFSTTSNSIYTISATTTFNPNYDYGNNVRTSPSGVAQSIVGGASGVNILDLDRVLGVTQGYGFSIGSGTLVLKDKTNALTLATYSQTGGVAQFQIGADGTTTGLAQILKGSNATGTNQNASTLTIRAGRPTGTGTGGTINFETPILGTSGTTQQATEIKASIGLNGLNIPYATASTIIKTDASKNIVSAIAGTDYEPAMINTLSSAATLTLTTRGYYSFGGTTATWTLPTIASSSTVRYVLMNSGSGNLTINSNAGGNDIKSAGTAVSSIMLTPGQTAILYNNTVTFFRQL